MMNGPLLRTKARWLACLLLILLLCGIGWAATGSWTTSGPISGTEVSRVVYSVALSPDGNMVYAGYGNGSVFSYSLGLTTTTTSSGSSGSGSSGSGTSTQNSGGSSSSGRHIVSTGHGSSSGTDSTTGQGSITIQAPPAGGTGGASQDAASGGSGSTSREGSQASPARFPFSTIPLIGAGSIVLVGSGWYIRRWWRYRQNPALFEEY